MIRFTRALARRPCRGMGRGLSTAGLGRPVYEKALEQHAAYVGALRSCGLAVTVLEADEVHPDSVFVEDTAVLCERAAVIARPGASSRRGEERPLAKTLGGLYPHLDEILAPGTLEGGDVMRAGDRFFVGISARTNEEGARQLAAILGRHGFQVVAVPLRAVLHLKTGVSYLENNRLLASGEFLCHPLLASFGIIPVPDGESYAANSLWVNGRVLVPSGFPLTREAIAKAGYETIPLDVSEFRKLDGGLSCLSLRF
ncbi:MAG: N(G),N(G)-dimethylarginine dimethylaminohydrolase [Candidatus Aminicenantes bacterium]|nr:N(G),N(G)-dimethylarginine dimethylaminohydrolase [Candidatus Aminicenantes bacterium]